MKLLRVALISIASTGSAVALLALGQGCVDGVTPDCSGANAAQCGPSLDASSAPDVSAVVPEAAPPPAKDAGDGGDLSDGGLLDLDASDGG